MNNQKIILFLTLALIIVINQPSISYACVGARPLGMGGAFIAIADDVNSIYWNPSGLAQLKQREATYTRTINNRNIYNYNDFIGIVSHNKKLHIAYGFGYIGESLKNYWQDKSIETIDNWYIFSIGKKISNNFYLGGNIRRMEKKIKLGSDSISDSDIAIDLSALYKFNKKLSLGLLIQDAKQTEFFNDEIKYIRNFRPSIAYKIDNSLILAASIYDATNETETDIDNRMRVGIEKKLTKNLTARTGSYGENPTTGFSYKLNKIRIDYAFQDKNLGDTHLLGIKYSY
ncbi:hypothetical protein [Sporohalobacter salinus]|uniref:hypothetical protein n=1 Tax=Sporohalobacter salinus TaxID=1494606 RepID=UPI0019602733|nr:hypothetical protein [Sporohalobacter salinus]MBM7623331.1 long-subunit fatty acid transport protein [Sporohalobacter salinus]